MGGCLHCLVGLGYDEEAPEDYSANSLEDTTRGTHPISKGVVFSDITQTNSRAKGG